MRDTLEVPLASTQLESSRTCGLSYSPHLLHLQLTALSSLLPSASVLLQFKECTATPLDFESPGVRRSTCCIRGNLRVIWISTQHKFCRFCICLLRSPPSIPFEVQSVLFLWNKTECRMKHRDPVKNRFSDTTAKSSHTLTTQLFWKQCVED